MMWSAIDWRVSDDLAATIAMALVATSISAAAGYYLRPDESAVPLLAGAIPRVSIAYLYMTDMKTFLARARYLTHHRSARN